MYFLEAKNPCFEMKNCSKSSYMCVFISPKKNSTIDFTKTFITKEWLVVESCPTPCWIALLMLYRLVYNIRSHFNELILAWNAYAKDDFDISSWSCPSFIFKFFVFPFDKFELLLLGVLKKFVKLSHLSLLV